MSPATAAAPASCENTAVLHFLLHNGSHCQAGIQGLITFIISVTFTASLSEMLGSSEPGGSCCSANIHCSSSYKCLCTLSTGTASHRAQFIFAFRTVRKIHPTVPVTVRQNGSSTIYSGRVGRFGVNNFGKCTGNTWQHDFCDFGTQGWGPSICGDFVGPYWREVEGQHARCHFESQKTPKGGPSWQESHPVYEDAQRYTVKAVFSCRRVYSQGCLLQWRFSGTVYYGAVSQHVGLENSVQ